MRAESTEITGWTLNVSRGGVRVIVEDPVELGKEYQITVGEEEVLARPARVVWVQEEADGQIAGVQFLDIAGTIPPPRGPPADEPQGG
jgi:c-di-GMP-binding flagellar brake protein YcgR